MNFEALISLLIQSNWVFLVGWILLLGAAFAASCSERSISATRSSPRSGDSKPVR